MPDSKYPTKLTGDPRDIGWTSNRLRELKAMTGREREYGLWHKRVHKLTTPDVYKAAAIQAMENDLPFPSVAELVGTAKEVEQDKDEAEAAMEMPEPEPELLTTPIVESVNTADDVRWAMARLQHMVKPEDAPTSSAYAMWKWAKESPDKFFTTFGVLIAKGTMEQNNETEARMVFAEDLKDFDAFAKPLLENP